MMKKAFRRAGAGLVLVVAACSGTEADESELVARVGDYTLTVDQVVDLLVDEENLAADQSVVRTLADFWIDYSLLVEAADRDSTFSDLDLEPLVNQQLWGSMVEQLRDSVIQFDTAISDRELEELYAEEGGDVEVRARHIMMGFPPQATPRQRDSVEAALVAVRQRIEGGASFEELARQLSQDPPTARVGGDLGLFGRGDMVAPFEEAAFALQPGQVSDVVETPMGLHLIRVDERRARGFAEVAPTFRLTVQDRRIAVAESTFIAAIESRVAPTVTEGAVPATQEIARNVYARLSRGAARRALVEWDGGDVTAGEIQTLFRVEDPRLALSIADTDSVNVANLLVSIARRELLVEEARAAGLRPPQAEIDSMMVDAATQLREASRMLGFFDIDQAPGEPRSLALARAVEEALVDNLTGATQFVPLPLVRFQLRDEESNTTFDAGIGQAIMRIAQVRANRALAPVEELPTPTDTTER